MTVALTVASLDARSGGPSYSVPALAHALAVLGVRVYLFSCSPAESDRIGDYRADGKVSVVLSPYGPLGSKLIRWAPGFTSRLATFCRQQKEPVILHDNGVWLPTNHAAARVARGSGLKRIVSPRGMLTDWALKHKGWKKRIAWWAYQRRDLERAQVLHATSRDEADGFRAIGLKQPIAIVPNGVEFPPSIPQLSTLPSSEALRRVDSPQLSKRTVLFLGRIHPIKGLLNLVEAWRAIKAPEWRVVVAGPDEAGHLKEVKEAVACAGVTSSFEFPGPVHGDDKWRLYREADIFALPSFSENFGVAVAEALASGVPVIITKGTPWQEVNSRRCGWWVDLGPAPLANALREAIALSDGERLEMGLRGRELIQERYAWPAIAQKMKSVYTWMLGSGAKPNCVVEN